MDVVRANENIKKIYEEKEKAMALMDKDMRTAKAKAETLQVENDLLKQRVAELEKTLPDWEKKIKELQGITVKKVEKIDAELPQEFKGKITVTDSGAIAVEGEVLFPLGQHTLRPEAKKAVEALAKLLLSPEYKDYYFRVDGHTDNVPIRVSGYESNWHLSAMRALSVLKELKAQGVPEERMFIGAFGEFKPRVPNEARGGTPKNRRVEITIVRSK